MADPASDRQRRRQHTLATMPASQDRFLRKEEVLEIACISDNTLTNWERAGAFPLRVKLGVGRRVGWLKSEVDAWVAEKVAEAKARDHHIKQAKAANSPNAWIGSVSERVHQAA